jgi:hypothetical protein
MKVFNTLIINILSGDCFRPSGITNKSPLRKKWAFFVLNAFEIYFKKRRKQKKPKLCAAKWTFVCDEPHLGNTRQRNPSGLKL